MGLGTHTRERRVQDSLVAQCPHCKSIWVCWNWFHSFGGDRAAYEKANPHMDPKDLHDWGHECWDCEHVAMTHLKVTNGVPYWLLKLYGKIKYRVFGLK